MSEQYPELPEQNVDAFYTDQKKKSTVLMIAMAICMLIWGSSIYAPTVAIPTVVVTTAIWLFLLLFLSSVIVKCPRCSRFNFSHPKCTICKFELQPVSKKES